MSATSLSLCLDKFLSVRRLLGPSGAGKAVMSVASGHTPRSRGLGVSASTQIPILGAKLTRNYDLDIRLAYAFAVSCSKRLVDSSVTTHRTSGLEVTHTLRRTYADTVAELACATLRGCSSDLAGLTTLGAKLLNPRPTSINVVAQIGKSSALRYDGALTERALRPTRKLSEIALRPGTRERRQSDGGLAQSRTRARAGV